MNKIYILLLALLVMAGCYKDKGNYDYKTMYAIEIDGIDESKKYELWFGEPFTMPEPIIRFTDSTQAHDDLSYQWKLDTFVVSTEKCLNVTFGIEPQGWNDIFGAFIVKDERTGISYSQRFRVTLLSNFTNGWMWMTENQGKAELKMLAPDITVKQDKLPNILFYLVNDNLIFNYATEYCLKHPTVPEPKDFEITDADYADFKAMVQKADFKYDQQTEKILKNLKEMAEFEGYLADASGEFEALEKKLSHNLERDLDHFSKDIKEMIAVEIIKRYYYQRGSIIQQLKDDDDLKEAAKILTAPEEYKKMLGAPLAKSDESKR